MPVLKSLTRLVYKFILEDRPERWVEGTPRLIKVAPITVGTVATDRELVEFYNSWQAGRLLGEQVAMTSTETTRSCPSTSIYPVVKPDNEGVAALVNIDLHDEVDDDSSEA
jgi:hypothetical protein